MIIENANPTQPIKMHDYMYHPFQQERLTVPVELEQRAEKLSFMFSQMEKIMDLEAAVTQDEAAGLLKYSDEHRQIMLTAQGAAFDVDHTLTHDPRLLVTEFTADGKPHRTGSISDEHIAPAEKENLQMLAVLSLAGQHISLLTGRDIYAHPSAWYVQQQMMEFAEVATELYKYGDQRGINFSWYTIPEDASYRPGPLRPSTIDGSQPAVLLVGSCNGAELRDVWHGYERVGNEYSIPEHFWLTLANDEEMYQLLSDSTDPKRILQMEQAFHAEKQHPTTEIDIAKNKLRKFMNVSYNGAKANLMFETHQITRNDKNLQDRWYEATGILITEEDKGSFNRAFNKLMATKFGPDENEWPFETTRAISNGQRVVDVIPRGVNKGTALKDIRAYVSTSYGDYFTAEGDILTVGDNHLPGANDNLMLENIPGSVSCSGDLNHGAIEYDDGRVVEWPKLLRDMNGMADDYWQIIDEPTDAPEILERKAKQRKDYSVVLTNRYLKDLVTVASFRRHQAAQLPVA